MIRKGGSSKGCSWSDLRVGTDFNAQAVKWNFDRFIADPGATLDTVSSVEIIDDYTIKLNITEWDATFITGFTRGSFIISPTAYEKLGAENE